MNIQFHHPDTFFIKVKNPSKFLGKKIYSSFLKLQGFRYNRTKHYVIITNLTTLQVVITYLVEDKGKDVSLSNSNDYIKEQLYNRSLWLYNQLLED